MKSRAPPKLPALTVWGRWGVRDNDRERRRVEERLDVTLFLKKKKNGNDIARGPQKGAKICTWRQAKIARTGKSSKGRKGKRSLGDSQLWRESLKPGGRWQGRCMPSRQVLWPNLLESNFKQERKDKREVMTPEGKIGGGTMGLLRVRQSERVAE